MSAAAKVLAKNGISLLEAAVLEALKGHSDGLGNVDIAKALDLYEPASAHQKNFMTWKIIARLLDSKRIELHPESKKSRPKYRLAN
jgi:hypothetical protein